MKISPAEAKPEFDLWYFAEVNGSSRIEHELLERLEPKWFAWRDHLRAYALENAGGRGGRFLLAFLDQAVEEQVEAIWQESPADGLAFHNLAITLVMSAAQSLVPELADGQCAPLPRPGAAAKAAFAELGLAWNDDGTINRQYAVFTPMPYVGGCEICFLSDSCPKSQAR